MSNQLFDSIVLGDRLALAKAITLVESENPNHQNEADELVSLALKLNKSSLRIGITGAPGVGKSTFINTLGTWLIKEKHKKVCVLAIDPSSQKNHGSILGDKTRMETLSMLETAYIRPSPAKGTLGGVARKTRESILLCEAAGYDTIIVETLGVGQSEYLADSLVDCLLLLLLPNAGDDLQAIKRGIMELADLIILTKADITEPARLNQAISDVANALQFIPNKFEGHKPSVCKSSINPNETVPAIWADIENFIVFQKSNGNFNSKRIEQKTEWIKEAVKEKLTTDFFNDPNIKKAIDVSLSEWLTGKNSLNALVDAIISKRKI